MLDNAVKYHNERSKNYVVINFWKNNIQIYSNQLSDKHIECLYRVLQFCDYTQYKTGYIQNFIWTKPNDSQVDYIEFAHILKQDFEKEGFTVGFFNLDDDDD